MPDDIKIELVSEEKRDEIYGEFISYSEANRFSNKMEIKNYYVINEEYKRQGKATPQFTFDAVKTLLVHFLG